MNRASFRPIIPISALLLASLACVAEDKHGALSTNCEPEVFTLYGEIDPTWPADVAPGQAYRVSVRPVAKESDFRITVTLYEISGDRVLIAQERSESRDEAVIAIPFTAPDSGRILVKLRSDIGMDGENMGDFSIELCED